MVRKSVGVACACFLSGAMLAVQPYVSSATANADPIEKLAGRWAGDGTMVPTYGRNEQFRCIVTYAVEDESSRIRQHLRCQGDRTRFDAVTLESVRDVLNKFPVDSPTVVAYGPAPALE